MSSLVFFHHAMVGFYERSGRAFPWRASTDPYAVLVSEVLLQRTRGENVVPVYQELLRRWPDPQRLSRARIATIEQVIRPIGLAKRASTLKALGGAMVDLGGVPRSPTELQKLPGIGPYGAHAVPVFAFGDDLPVVDWVIARVLRRYFGLSSRARPNSDGELWDLATELALLGSSRSLWLGTLDFAAEICVPTPKCERCPISTSCRSAFGDPPGTR